MTFDMDIPVSRDIPSPQHILQEDANGHIHIYELAGWHDGKPVYRLASKEKP